MQPPSDLYIPIIVQKSSVSFLVKPHAHISPKIDGKQSSFFEWIGCGYVDESKLYSTMDRVRGPIEMIYYGHDDQNIFLAFEGDVASLKMSHMQLEIIIEESGEHFNCNFSMDRTCENKGIHFAVDERIEFAIAKSRFSDYSSVHLRFEILNGTEIIQTMPGYGALFIDLEETYVQNWFI